MILGTYLVSLDSICQMGSETEATWPKSCFSLELEFQVLYVFGITGNLRLNLSGPELNGLWLSLPEGTSACEVA